MSNMRNPSHLKEEKLYFKSGLKYTYISASNIALNLIATDWWDICNSIEDLTDTRYLVLMELFSKVEMETRRLTDSGCVLHCTVTKSAGHRTLEGSKIYNIIGPGYGYYNVIGQQEQLPGSDWCVLWLQKDWRKVLAGLHFTWL